MHYIEVSASLFLWQWPSIVNDELRRFKSLFYSFELFWQASFFQQQCSTGEKYESIKLDTCLLHT